MGINSTEVAYSFGQLGSVYTTTGDAIIPPTDKVFVAVTMITDTVFDSTGGLIAESRTTRNAAGTQVTSNIYIGTEAAAHDLDAASETVDEGSGGQVVDSVTFPAGITIYGRWTEIEIDTGSCVAYIGD